MYCRTAEQDCDTELPVDSIPSWLQNLGSDVVMCDTKNELFVQWICQKKETAPFSGTISWPKLETCIRKLRSRNGFDW